MSELPEYNELRQQLDVAEEKEEDLDTANN